MEPQTEGSAMGESGTRSPQLFNGRKMFAITNVLSGERAEALFVKEQLDDIIGHSSVHVLNFKDPDWRANAVDFIRRQVNGKPENVFIVAGGDGTVSLALELVDESGVNSDVTKPLVHTAVIPMGTGNDLSRSVGFGPGFSKDGCCCCCKVDSLQPTIDNIAKGTFSQLDLWTVTIRPKNPSKREEEDDANVKTLMMVNYFSIGFDAAIATRFANFRHNNPRLCSSRSLNKLWYGCYGLNAMCCEPVVSSCASMVVEGKTFPLPDGIKSLVVSNVDSFAAGVTLWKKPDASKRYVFPDGSAIPKPACREGDGNKCPFTPVDISDGILECQGIFGSTHMGMMQMKTRHAERIAQGSDIRIQLDSPIMCQIDGEPLEDVYTLCENGGGITIDIKFLRKAFIVASSEEK